jgi:hypothetical protein
MTEDDRHSRDGKDRRPDRGTRPIAAIVPTVTRDAFRRMAPGTVQLVEAWTGIVGPALAEATVPRQLTQGTLTISCNGPVAMELQHLSVELIARINQSLGTQTVRRLRFVQSLRVPTVARPVQRPNEVAEKIALEAVADLPEGPLRAALAALGRAVLTEEPARRR